MQGNLQLWHDFHSILIFYRYLGSASIYMDSIRILWDQLKQRHTCIDEMTLPGTENAEGNIKADIKTESKPVYIFIF